MYVAVVGLCDDCDIKESLALIVVVCSDDGRTRERKIDGVAVEVRLCACGWCAVARVNKERWVWFGKRRGWRHCCGGCDMCGGD